MRPGEKLLEEIVAVDETIEASSAEGILRVIAPTTQEWTALYQNIIELERLAVEDDASAVIKRLIDLVPTYRPWGTNA